MITQPDYQESQLKACIEEGYGFKVRTLTSVPWGETTWGYTVAGEGGEQFFLKVYPGDDVAEKQLEMVARLHTQCHIETLVYPLPAADEKLKIPFGKHAVVMFNYVEGADDRNRRLTINQYKVLGRVLAKIHHSTPQVADYPVKERFEIPFVKPFQKLLHEIEKSPGTGNEPQKELKNLLLPLIPRLEREVSSLMFYHQKASTSKPKFVICHGDLKPGNILVTPKGDVVLADWDAPLLAPKERDLAFLTGPKMMFVLKGYRTIESNQDVDDDVIAYYQHRRNVIDLAAYATRILHGTQDDDQSWHDLDEMILLLGEMQVWERKELKKR